MKSPLLATLFDEEVERRPLTVSEVNEQVKRVLERGFASVWLEGEISNFAEANSGHWYFTLKDEFAQITAACFRGANYKIRFKPFDGLQVRVWGKISVYEPRGEYQIIVEALDPVGEGALKIAFEQLKAKLAKEGLFDDKFKRELPFFPKRIGVVTSPNGAAIHDILHVISRRTRTVDVVIIPTRVQGEGAGEEISNAIKLANAYNLQASEKIDVLIVGRGGGSSEDLWAFNDEKLARTIRNSKIPIISAVGHETDFTIADFVADFRAPTPSAAAEIVAAQESQIEAFLAQMADDLQQAVGYKLLSSRSHLQTLMLSSGFGDVRERIYVGKQRQENAFSRMQNFVARKIQVSTKSFDELQKRFSPITMRTQVIESKARLSMLTEKRDTVIRAKLETFGEKVNVAMASLDALSPLSVLRRGFSLTQKFSGEIIRESRQVEIGENVQIRLANGKLKVQIVETEQ